MAVKFDASKITQLLQEQLDAFEVELDVAEVGEVIMVGDGVARVHGLDNVMSSELVEFPNDVFGMALNLEEDNVGLVLFGESQLVREGDLARRTGRVVEIGVGKAMLGRVVNPLGQPIDGRGEMPLETQYPFYNNPLRPFQRERISQPLDVGIRAINGLLTIGKGQKIGIFAGSGVGKSILLGQIARNTEADVNVIALIGERGREVKEFIEKDLGEEGLKKSVLVVATSDDPPLLRRRGAFVATALAEYFRDQGRHVLFMMDSLTRFAMAQREIGLSIGEPPTTRGYTPSVFAYLPSLLERVGGVMGGGSITGIYTVLVEGDDMNEPVADSARSILDGHIILSRDLATQNHYPAIDITQSISRVMRDITTPEHQNDAHQLLQILGVYKKVEDLVQIGAYKEGNNPKADYALSMIDPINIFLKQRIKEKADLTNSLKSLHDLFTNQQKKLDERKKSTEH